jgi:2-polyprenyl-6-methoxyphenol hydroxylase-like FAD-dependent oxidoreductase
MLSRLDVGVVGGSIAGAMVAVLLMRSGHRVTVFERSASRLEGRGAGLVVPLQLLDELIRRELLDRDVAVLRPIRRVWCVPDGTTPLGRVIGEQPMNGAHLHWGQIYRGVQGRLVDAQYLGNSEVTAVSDVPTSPRVHLADGSSYSFDLVVGADGYGSFVRGELAGDVQPEFAGYPAWRGTVPEADLDDVGVLDGQCLSPAIPSGHANFYLVPGKGDAIEPRHRVVNWLIYDGQAPAEVAPWGTANANTRVTEAGPGRLSRKQLDYLHGLAVRELPPWFSAIVLATHDPYLQPVCDLHISHYVNGNVCLVGDAASIARPHAGSGVTKAVDDVISLADSLEVSSTLQDALSRYDVQRNQDGARLVELGRSLGRAWVTDAPHWRGLSRRAFQAWSAATSQGAVYFLPSDEGRARAR